MKRARRSLRLFSWRRAASSAAAPGRASGLRAWMPAPRLGPHGASSDEISIEDSPGNNSQTMPESAVPVLASYIPAALVLQYCGVELGPKGVEQRQQLEPPAQPVRSDFNGAIGFIDVSGFTALSEKLGPPAPLLSTADATLGAPELAPGGLSLFGLNDVEDGAVYSLQTACDVLEQHQQAVSAPRAGGGGGGVRAAGARAAGARS